MRGEEDFASRIAFSLMFVLPAVAVDRKLVAHGRVPEADDVAAEMGRLGFVHLLLDLGGMEEIPW